MKIIRHTHHSKKGSKKKIWKILVLALVIFFAIDGLIIYKFYNDAEQSVNSTYKNVKHTNNRNVSLKGGQPFSILLLGVDTGDYGRTYQGRSDTIMLAVVNPKTKTTTLASIPPRDTKVAIPGHGFNNKINAAYSYSGVSGAMNIVQSYLNVPVDHYIEMNMGGLVQLSSALGPIKVNNDLDFTNMGVHFPKGEITLNKDNILAYTRMRYEDPRGDYGRQLRQRAVLTQLVEKITTLNGIMRYQDVLSALSSNMKTDITFDQMKTIASKYRKADNVKQLQLQGNGQMIDGVSYEVVPQSNLNKITTELRSALDIKK
nr:LCP family protein [Liquorilactobacillus satsumensis]